MQTRKVESKNIIEMLEKLDGTIKNSTVNVVKGNELVCKLIRLQLTEFFDDIYISYDNFRDNNWEIDKTLCNNKDVLFYNNRYLKYKDEERFNEVFTRYVEMIKNIFSKESKLITYLDQWTDRSQNTWKIIRPCSYLKTILVRDFQIISPAYTCDIYHFYIKKYGEDDKIKIATQQHLKDIKGKLNVEIKEFKKRYSQIVDKYVLNCPMDDYDSHTIEFVRNVILEILNLSEKLIGINIYCVHPIINYYTEYYLPLDEINNYNSKKYGHRELYII